MVVGSLGPIYSNYYILDFFDLKINTGPGLYI